MAEIEFTNLFQPISIGSLQLKNHIVMLPMHLAMDPRTKQWRAFLVRRAKGGVAAIVHAGIPTDLLLSDECWGETGAIGALMENLHSLVQDVHEAGAKIGVQLLQLNCCPQTVTLATSYPTTPVGPLPEVEWVAPSAWVEPTPFIHGGVPPGITVRELTIQEIQNIIDKFTKAAAKAKEVGFDFVEVHGAHGVMPCQFFSPLDNRRTDRYGGDLIGRMRFGLELVKATRSSVGKDYPLFYRIPGEDNIAGGQTLADAIAFAVELEKAGVDCFDVTIGVSPDRLFPDNCGPLKERGEGVFVPYAEAIKQHVRVPVIGVGNIRAPQFAESLLSEGRVDLIGVGRQTIADPDWPKKVMEKRLREIVACDSCNVNCWRGPYGPLPPGVPFCKMNLEAGREREATFSRDESG